MSKEFIKKTIFDYSILTIGSLLVAIGLVLFLVPNQIAAGGVSGLATVFYYLFNLPVGRMILALNIPLFILGVKALGTSFGIRTVYGILVLSFLTDLLSIYLPESGAKVITEDPLLAALYGGLTVGIGLGLVFKSEGTTGGTDLVALVISRYTAISSGKALLIVDFCVILLAGVVFDAELALYALISLAITSRTIDLVQQGFNIAKGSFIISKHSDEIRRAVIEEMDRGITLLKGQGGFSGEQKDILLCVISRSEITELKRVVSQVDQDAFVIITEVNEVLGEGFKEDLKPEIKGG